MASVSGDGVSLEQAIRSKYCNDWIEYPTGFKETCLYYRPGAVPVQKLQTIVLERQGVSHVGDKSELAELCPELKELHLFSNSLKQLKDVKSVLTTLQKLTFLDLSHNHLVSLTSSNPSPPLSSTLQTLVVNCTYISWSAVQNCLEACPGLQELHLSNNGYSSVHIDSSYSHSSLKRLHINDNSISQWAEFEKLCQAFPSLHTLVAISNPLKEIAAVMVSAFKSLYSLTLHSTQLSNWSSIESLSSLPALTDLRLRDIPLGCDLSDEERRFSVIARMPRLHWLNKTEITSTEREHAERWLIR